MFFKQLIFNHEIVMPVRGSDGYYPRSPYASTSSPSRTSTPRFRDKLAEAVITEGAKYLTTTKAFRRAVSSMETAFRRNHENSAGFSKTMAAASRRNNESFAALNQGFAKGGTSPVGSGSVKVSDLGRGLATTSYRSSTGTRASFSFTPRTTTISASARRSSTAGGGEYGASYHANSKRESLLASFPGRDGQNYYYKEKSKRG